MRYHAMIGSIGYVAVEADNDDEARERAALALKHRGGEDGLYKRWKAYGMRVATMRREVFRRMVEARQEQRA